MRFPHSWQEFVEFVKETLSAILTLWRDPQTRDTMQFYASILLVIGLLYGFRIYRAITRKHPR